MTQNKLTDLNNHLFAQLERLGDEDLKGEELAAEIERARAVSQVASQVISNGNLVIKAAQFSDGRMNADAKLPPMLAGGE